ncbi:MAG TPA: DNA methyltransferase, partial [Rugosimonospora sp.]|nr:DNA methyltransferase [Rugosimonospora sp.]
MVTGDPEAARRAETERAFAAIAGIHAALRAAGDTSTLPAIVATLFTGGTPPAGPADPWVPAARALNWSQVSPLLLGAVRQLDRAAPTRRHLGEHYTSEENVHKTIGPLFLDDLRAELAGACDDRALHRLWDKLSRLRFLDPACGSGNFLVVAYRELRALESEIARRLGSDDTGRVRLEHFHGIELDPGSADLARLALEVAGRQAGGDPTRPRIVTGCALTLDWADLLPPGPDVVVVGNPPFRGHKERTAAQGAQLRRAWGTSRLRHLDYATGWFAKALSYFGESAGRWAFVCTNSVTQGEGVPPLFRPILAAGWRISFAHRTFAWSAGGPAAAGVHVVIVGFTRDAPRPRLFDYRHPTAPASEVPAAHINPYLVDGPDVLVYPARRPLCPHLPPIRAGSTGIDWNHLTVGPAEVAAVRADPVAARYLRRFAGGRELINDEPRWCLWMAGPDFDPDDLSRSALLRERVARVRAHRAAASRAGTRRLAHTPHLFGEIRQPAGAYLALPQTFAAGRDYATAARLDSEVIASVKLFTAPDPDGLLFALFSSALFLTWQKTVGGRLKSDPSLSASV